MRTREGRSGGSVSPLTCENCGDVLTFADIQAEDNLCRRCAEAIPSLFDPPPFQKHSETSRDAAERIADGALSLRERVYLAIAAHGPVSDRTLQAITHLDGSTERPRRVELLRAGLIRESGVEILPSGRKATTWAVVR